MQLDRTISPAPPTRSKRRRRLRTHKLAATLVALILLVSLGGGIELAYGSVKSQADQLQAHLTSQLQAGQDELEAGREALKQANAKHDVSLTEQAIAHFVSAKAMFVAISKSADDSKFLRYVEYAPGAGSFARSRHEAINAIAQMGAAMSDAGQDLSRLDAQIIKPPSGNEAGRTLLTVMEETNKGLPKVRNDLASAQRAAARVSAQLLPVAQQSTFMKARDSIDATLAGFVEFERLLPIFRDVLGANGPRTYLIEQVNPIELRAGGGFMGTYSVLGADKGALRVVRSGDTYDLAEPRPALGQSGFIPQPSPYREVIPWVSWSFVDTNLYPDFPTNARVAEQFAQPRLGHLDGVIAIDFYAVAKMLELTGPLAIPGFGLTVDSNNLVPELVRQDVAGTPIHKAILAALAGPLMQRIAALPADRWPALIGALNSLASQRHIQVFANNDTVQAEFDRVRWSGTLNPTAATDFAMEVEDNYSGKANYFLSRQFTVELTRRGSDLHHKITVNLVNATPYGSYERTYYHAVVRLYTGSNVSSVAQNLTPVRYSNPAPPSNTKMTEGWVWVGCCGANVSVVFEYDTPWRVRDGGGYSMYLQKQPGTIADKIFVTWNPGSGDSYKTAGDFGSDQSIALTQSSVTINRARTSDASLPVLDL